MINVSLASPAYNEEDCIKENVFSWSNFLEKSSLIDNYEIVVCNDGSADRTLEILTEVQGSLNGLNVIDHERNQGAAAALKTAINASKYEWTLLIDSDGQFPIENLERMVKVIGPSTQAVIGARVEKVDTLFAKFGSWLTTFLCNIFYRTSFRDYSCVFKLVRTDLLKSLRQEAGGLNSSTELTCMLVENKFNIEEVEISHSERETGESSLSGMNGLIHGYKRLSFVVVRGLKWFLFKST